MGLNLTKLVDGVAYFQSTIIPKGAYDSGVIYISGESVSYGGKSYVAIQPTEGNLPTDTTYWQLLCEGGSGSGGHTIQDDGTPMDPRTNLNFIGATVEDNSVDDSTDITIDVPVSGTDFDPVGTDNSDDNATNTQYSGLESSKQDVLESGTNIKTINSNSLLGSGNIDTPNTTYTDSDFDIKDLTDSTSLRSTWSGKMSNPMEASGDVIYGGTSGTPTKLVKGTDDQVLTLASGVPTWADAGGGSSDLQQTITFATTMAWDVDDGNIAVITLTDDGTLSNPTNFAVGQLLKVIKIQDGTGGNILSFGTYFKFPGGVTPVQTGTASSRDTLTFRAYSSTELLFEEISYNI